MERHCFVTVATALATLFCLDAMRHSSAAEPPVAGPTVVPQVAHSRIVETATLSAGDLKVVLRGNSQSTPLLSGIDSLLNVRAAPGFDAFDPDSRGASAGVNFEHITSGHRNDHNKFSPRSGPYKLHLAEDGHSATLVRDAKDDPWAMSSMLKYTLTAPHYVDVEFRCTAHDVSRFGKRRYAALFFANYLNDVRETALNFRGIEEAGGSEKWIRADAPPGHTDWMRGGTYRSAAAAPLEYDANHNFKINLWSYDYPRFTQPFYYGRAAHEMTLILMFNKLKTADDEIRFALYKFKLPKLKRPAWDFEYVIPNIQQDKPYGFNARLVWKRFVSAEDCQQEYQRWAAGRP